MTASTQPASTRHAGLATLWFGLLGAPIAWSIQEMVAYAVVAHACYPFSQPLLSSRMPTLSAIDVIVSLLMLLVGVLAARAAYRSWTRTGPAHPRMSEGGRARFMATGGLMLSVVFLFGMLMNTLVLVIEPACS